jgi:hypothetical protein
MSVIHPFLNAAAVGGEFDFASHLREVMANTWDSDWEEVRTLTDRLRRLHSRGLAPAFAEVKRTASISVKTFPHGTHWLFMHSKTIEILNIPHIALFFNDDMLSNPAAYGSTMRNWLDTTRSTCERALRCNQLIDEITDDINQTRQRAIYSVDVLAVVDPSWATFKKEPERPVALAKKVRARISTLDLYEVRSCVNQIMQAMAACNKRGIQPWTLY